MNTSEAGARLDRLAVSPFHRRILCLIGAGMFLDSFDIYLAGGVLAALGKSGWSTMESNATFLSATFVGMLIGAVAAGVLGDAKGRKYAYQFNLLLFGVASLAGAAAPDMMWLIVCRFFMGVGLGAEIVIGYGSIGEFIPPAVRGRWSSYLSLITNSALLVSAVLGYLLIPSVGWRTMFVIVGCGALCVWVLRRKMPESPRWLESKGRHAEADAVLASIEAESQVASTRAGSPAQAAEGGAARNVAQGAPRAGLQGCLRDDSWQSLFKPPFRSRLFVGVIVQIAINIMIYGFIVWVPTFLVKQGLGVASSLGYTALMSLGGPVGAFIGVLIADRVGRRKGLIAIALIASAVGWFYAHSTSVEMATVLGFILFTLTYLMVALGVATYIPELFPTGNRMRANGVASATGRIAGIFAPQAAVLLYATGGIQQVLLVIIAALLLMAVVLALFGTETNQRSLEEISQLSPDLARAATGANAQTTHLH
ncbi:MFS transporter [Bordetella sp. N]|uniref:MFS transporter n=1 Tax=Bordetella sp. N TaxID=1746199 RepID=UPI0007100C07|nr:MFS transporter [Bordetella sp. N]ALM82455.1 MFS transporter [Bordetella sp. N]